MSYARSAAEEVEAGGGLGFFERYLSLWVALCMVAGLILGKVLPGLIAVVRGLEFGQGQSDKRTDRSSYLADDYADDDEGGFFRRA